MTHVKKLGKFESDLKDVLEESFSYLEKGMKKHGFSDKKITKCLEECVPIPGHCFELEKRSSEYYSKLRDYYTFLIETGYGKINFDETIKKFSYTTSDGRDESDDKVWKTIITIVELTHSIYFCNMILDSILKTELDKLLSYFFKDAELTKEEKQQREKIIEQRTFIEGCIAHVQRDMKARWSVLTTTIDEESKHIIARTMHHCTSEEKIRKELIKRRTDTYRKYLPRLTLIVGELEEKSLIKCITKTSEDKKYAVMRFSDVHVSYLGKDYRIGDPIILKTCPDRRPTVDELRQSGFVLDDILHNLIDCVRETHWIGVLDVLEKATLTETDHLLRRRAVERGKIDKIEKRLRIELMGEYVFKIYTTIRNSNLVAYRKYLMHQIYSLPGMEHVERKLDIAVAKCLELVVKLSCASSIVKQNKLEMSRILKEKLTREEEERILSECIARADEYEKLTFDCAIAAEDVDVYNLIHPVLKSLDRCQKILKII